MFSSRWILVAAACAGACAAWSGDTPHEAALSVVTRRRVQESGRWRLEYARESWPARATALIICDMWDRHWCAGATRRVEQMAPRMHAVAQAARSRGVLVIHAPSDTVDGYGEHPARLRARNAPRAAQPPAGIHAWSPPLPAEAGAPWPIDQSDGGCDCEPRCAGGNPWRAQTAAIAIAPEDAISDSGVEIWNLIASRGMTHVLVMGVHTNMCVIGRPFGLRNMVRAGMRTALVRDMTDTMYNPRRSPFVNHFTGTDLVVAHIEKHVCPTVTSTVFTGADPFRFPEDTRPRVVFISAENEYDAAYTMPALADVLMLEHGLSADVLQGSTSMLDPGRNWIPEMRAIDTADALVLFVRRRALPIDDMARLRAYLDRGKPLIALRTSSHAFALRGGAPPGCAVWEDFDRAVLGCTYRSYPRGETRVTIDAQQTAHPILQGLEPGPFQVRETLYRCAPLASGCTVLLLGTCVDGEGDDPRYRLGPGEPLADEPLAWTTTYGQAKVFYTSLGSGKASFATPWFQRMLLNAVFWALDRPAPGGGD